MIMMKSTVKKYLACLLTLAMCLGLVPSLVFAAEGGETLELEVNKPPAVSGLVYTGTEQSGVSPEEGYELGGTAGAVDVGEYTATATLREGYTWSDGSTDPVDITWFITKAELTAAYKGETIASGDTPSLEGEVTGFVNGETAATAAGYTAPTLTAPAAIEAGQSYELTPAGGEAANYQFTYVAGTLTVNAATEPDKPEKPQAVTGLVYDGTKQTGVAEGDHYTLAGDYKATNAGEYTATATLQEGYTWSDGSSDPIEITWSITKAELTATYQGETIAPGGTPQLAVAVTGFVDGENAETAADYEAPALTAPASMENGKSYSLTPAGGHAANYTFTYVPGNLTVGPVELEPGTYPMAFAAGIGATYEQGTYTVTANLFIPGELNAQLPGVTAYMTNPNNPLGIGGHTGIPNTPVADNATLVIGEEGSKTLTLDVVNPVFTLQQLRDGTTVHVQNTTRDEAVYSGGSVTHNGRITQIIVTLDDDSGAYTFTDCVEFPTILGADWTVPLSLTVDFSEIPLKTQVDEVNKPQAATGLIYTGTEQAGVAAGEGYELSGTVSATGTGDYTATATLQEGYTWSDGSTAPVEISWSIAKAELTAAYTGETITLDDTPVLAVEVTGFVNSETAATAAGYVTPSVTAPATIEAGESYELTPAGGAAANYQFKYVAGALIVTGPEKPQAATGLSYTGTEQTGVAQGEHYTLSGDYMATAVGDYMATATLQEGYTWSDGSSGPVEITWSIAKAELTAAYRGEAITPDGTPALAVKVTGFVNGETAETAAGYAAPTVTAPTAIEAGQSYELTPTGGAAANYRFKYVAGALVVSTISLTPVQTPQATAGLVYTGKDQTGVAAGAGYVLSDTVSAKDAGSYTTTAALQEGYIWSDGSTAIVEITWSIAKKKLQASATGQKIREGQPTPSLTVYFNGFVNNENAQKAKDFVSPTISAPASLEKGKKYFLIPEGGSAANYEFEYVGAYAYVGPDVPRAATGLIYNGTEQTGVSSGVGYSLIGTTKATEPGEYTARAIIDDGFWWYNSASAGIGGTATATIKWSIAYDQPEKPRAKTGLVYNGTEQTGVAQTGAVDQYAYTLTGTTKATDAGEYTANATLNPGYAWLDGSSEPVEITWSIAKAQLTATYKGEKIISGGTPQLAVEVTGFVNEDTAATAAGYQAPALTAPASIEGGKSYTLTPSGGQAANYAFAYVTGNLTVDPPVTLEPGTYTVTANLLVPGSENVVLSNVTIYLASPVFPPTSPAEHNAGMVVGSDGKITLTIALMNPSAEVFTLQNIESGPGVTVVEAKRGVGPTETGYVECPDRIQELTLELENTSGEYQFTNCKEYPTILRKYTEMPILLRVDFNSAVNTGYVDPGVGQPSWTKTYTDATTGASVTVTTTEESIGTRLEGASLSVAKTAEGERHDALRQTLNQMYSSNTASFDLYTVVLADDNGGIALTGNTKTSLSFPTTAKSYADVYLVRADNAMTYSEGTAVAGGKVSFNRVDDPSVLGSYVVLDADKTYRWENSRTWVDPSAGIAAEVKFSAFANWLQAENLMKLVFMAGKDTVSNPLGTIYKAAFGGLSSDSTLKQAFVDTKNNNHLESQVTVTVPAAGDRNVYLITDNGAGTTAQKLKSSYADGKLSVELYPEGLTADEIIHNILEPLYNGGMGKTPGPDTLTGYLLVADEPDLQVAGMPQLRSANAYLTYTGKEQSLFPGRDCNVEGTTAATDAGEYTATVTPEAGYVWSDGSTAPVEIKWSIAKAKLKASATLTKLIEGRTLNLTVYFNGFVNNENAQKAKDFVSPTISAPASLEKGKKYLLTPEGGSAANYEFEYVGAYTYVGPDVPQAATGLVYNGTEQTGVSPGVGYSLIGTTKATEPGEYTAKAILDDGFGWGNYLTAGIGSGSDATIKWSIAPASDKPKKPQAATGLVYNGTEQTGVAQGEHYSLSGDYKAMAAGEYTAIATPGEGYTWSDGSADPVEIAWSIAKAELTATYQGETIAPDGTPTLTVEVTGFVNGETAATAAGYVAPSVAAPATIEAGQSYGLTPAGGAADNYQFAYVAGTLEVKEAEQPEEGRLAPGTYTITANPYIPADENIVIKGLQVYIASSKFPPAFPASYNAELVVSEDGKLTLSVPLDQSAGDIFTIQNIESGSNLRVISTERGNTNTGGADYGVGVPDRITSFTVELGDYGGEYQFSNTKQYITMFSKHAEMPIRMSVDFQNAKKQYAEPGEGEESWIKTYTDAASGVTTVVETTESAVGAKLESASFAATKNDSGEQYGTLQGSFNKLYSTNPVFDVYSLELKDDSGDILLLANTRVTITIPTTAQSEIDAFKISADNKIVEIHDTSVDNGTSVFSFTTGFPAPLGAYATINTDSTYRWVGKTWHDTENDITVDSKISTYVDKSTGGAVTAADMILFKVLTGKDTEGSSLGTIYRVGFDAILGAGGAFNFGYVDADNNNHLESQATVTVSGSSSDSVYLIVDNSKTKTAKKLNASHKDGKLTFDLFEQGMTEDELNNEMFKWLYYGSEPSQVVSLGKPGAYLLVASDDGPGVASMPQLRNPDGVTGAGSWIYNGQPRSLTPGQNCQVEGDVSATDAGSYNISAVPDEGYAWPDGTSEQFEITWSITKARLESKLTSDTINPGETPALTTTVTGFVNGETAETAKDYAAPILVLPAKLEAGKYYYLKTQGGSAANYEFKLYSQGCIYVNPDKPQDNLSFVYSSGWHEGIPFSTYSSYTLTGTPQATAAGEYSATATLNKREKGKGFTSWSDGTTEPVTVNWSITKAPLTATYEGEVISADGTPTLEVKVTGFAYYDSESTAAGYTPPTLTAPEKLEPGQEYELTPAGGAADNYEFIYVPGILKVEAASSASIAKPEAATDLIYTGLEQTGVAGAAGYTLSGVDKAIGAGEYTATATLESGFTWSDDSSDPVEITWSIAKAELTAAYKGETIALGDTPALAVEVTGFVNGETTETATGYVAPTVTAPATIEAGRTYELTPAGGEAVNYQFKYVADTLTLNPEENEPANPPAWTQGSKLTAQMDNNNVALSWPAATDSAGVSGYRVYQNGELLDTVSGDTRIYTVSGLSKGQTYTFKVEAGNTAGRWSTDGPAYSLYILPDSAEESTITDADVFIPTQTDPVSGDVSTDPLPLINLAATTSLSPTPVQVELPAGVTITAPATWDGIIRAPEVSSATIGNATVNAAIEVGFREGTLTFDKAVKLLIPGQAGKSVGYFDSNGAFYPINTVITATDTDGATAELAAKSAREGKQDAGSDLVLWTMHFTKFVTYTPTPSGSNKGSRSALLTPPELKADSSGDTAGSAVEITFTDNTAWRTAINIITVDGKALTNTQYTVTAGSIKIVADVLTAPGSYQIAVRASGYSNAAVTQIMKEANTAAVVRLSGNDRFETAVAIAEQGWRDGAGNVVLVYAFDFPDALAAAPLAKKLNAPILLTAKAELSSTTLVELEKLKTKQITLIGGTGVISQNVEDVLVAKYGRDNVTRYGGLTRYATAVAIAEAMGPTDKAVLVNGEAGHYPDALAISPYAASNGIPILFTEAARLPAETAQALTTQNIGTTIVVGGEGAVAAAVFNQLPGAGRYGGADRYATAVAVIEGLEHKLTEIYVVTGLNFPDALTAGNLASYTQSPLLMVDNGLPEAIKTFLTTTKTAVTEIKIIGGKGVITDAQVNAIFEILK